MEKISMFEKAKTQLIKGNYDSARRLFEKCKDKDSNNIYVNIEVSIIDLITGNEKKAKEKINFCMKKERLRTLEYLKQLDNFGKKHSNFEINSYFTDYIYGLEKLKNITN